MKVKHDGILWMLLLGETRQVRFWFSIVSFAFGIETFSPTFVEGNPLLMLLASDEVWRLAFFVHATAVMYGVITKQYNRWLLILEGMLGTAIYVSLGLADILFWQHPSPTLFCSLVAMYLLIRYPTHYTTTVEVLRDQ